MTPTEVHQLLVKCKAATPGPWKYEYGEVVKLEDRGEGSYSLLIASEGGDGEWKYDGRFIAAANPAAIQTLAENYLAALEVVRKYSGCDGFCGIDECVCSTQTAQNFLKQVGMDASEGKGTE